MRRLAADAPLSISARDIVLGISCFGVLLLVLVVILLALWNKHKNKERIGKIEESGNKKRITGEEVERGDDEKERVHTL